MSAGQTLQSIRWLEKPSVSAGDINGGGATEYFVFQDTVQSRPIQTLRQHGKVASSK